MVLATLPLTQTGDPSDGMATGVTKPYYFAVLTSDYDLAVDWYLTTFGLEKIDQMQADDKSWRIANLRNADLWIEIIWLQSAAPAQRDHGLFKVGFFVPDLASIASRLGNTMDEPPRIIEDPAHKVRFIQLKDPDGNIIQIFESEQEP